MKIELFPGRREFDQQCWAFEFEQLELQDFLSGFYESGRVRLFTQLVGRDYHMNGDLFAPLVLECSRCLERFRLPLKLELDWTVRRVESPAPEEELSEREFEILPEAQDLDFTARLREAIIFNLPVKPLCRADCRGLCPTCGQNRNVKECHCRREAADPRWDRLRQLLH